MFIPLSASDDKIKLPKATLALIGINAFIYFFSSQLEGFGLQAFYDFFGLVPSRVLSADFIIWYKTFPFLTSMFIHGSFLHLAGNCLFLYVFGSELENRFGPRKYLYFYLISGIYCGLFYAACEWQSPMPVIGASGAISGLMGAVLLLFPTARIRLLFMSFFPFYARIVNIPAYICIGLWFLMQLAFGLLDLNNGTAYWGHVGGFIGGVAFSKIVLTRAFKHRKKPRKHIIIIGKRKPTPDITYNETVQGRIHGFCIGTSKAKIVYYIIGFGFLFYLILLLNFYLSESYAIEAFWWTVIEFVLIVVPIAHILFLSQALSNGLSSFFYLPFSFLYEGSQDHEVKPDIYKAEFFEQKGDYLTAIREYRRLFARFPDRIDILYRIAEIYRTKLKDTRKAIGSCKALLNYPEDGEYAYCVRHARELIEILERDAQEHPEPIGIDGVEIEEDFVVSRF
ncbi:MAG: rhomboid family intramembrane serine protease [Deltaproteobacteria bacterium]|nr:rhomboid family intramembrane serine protease [Candidatus Zymogenaceae bacterium]